MGVPESRGVVSPSTLLSLLEVPRLHAEQLTAGKRGMCACTEAHSVNISYR